MLVVDFISFPYKMASAAKQGLGFVRYISIYSAYEVSYRLKFLEPGTKMKVLEAMLVSVQIIAQKDLPQKNIIQSYAGEDLL